MGRIFDMINVFAKFKTHEIVVEYFSFLLLIKSIVYILIMVFALSILISDCKFVMQLYLCASCKYEMLLAAIIMYAHVCNNDKH